MITEKELIKKEDIKERLKVKLTSDLFFKSLFLNNEDIFNIMLKDILLINENIDLAVAGYEEASLRMNGKTYRGDIVVRFTNDIYVSVEMNNTNTKDVLLRNQLFLGRLHSTIVTKGLKDKDLSLHKLVQLNFNHFENECNLSLDICKVSSIITGRRRLSSYTFFDVDLDKCKELVYNLGIEKTTKAERWGAILEADSIDEISYILGDDMLSMEQKEKFLNGIRKFNDDERLIQDWVWEENEILKQRGELAYAKEQGVEQGIEQGIEDNKREVVINMLEEKIDYEIITKVTGKTVEEIKEIEETI